MQLIGVRLLTVMTQCIIVVNMTNADPDELIISSQVGVILGKSPRTIARLAESGEIDYASKLPGPNGAYLFRRADIEKLAAERAEATKPAEAAS